MTSTSTERVLSNPQEVPPTEVSHKPRRRTFTAEYKRRILKEAEACRKNGGVGALLRREGLYNSHLVDWRQARDRGDLAGDTLPRGPKAVVEDPRDARIAELEKENARLLKRNARAEALLELQKKVAEFLGSPFQDPSDRP
jgi:transposase-like protein